jgi:luciferase family oxidoreductase group 1
MQYDLSILDLVPVGAGRTASEALRDSLELAHLGDRLGYTRLWYAEHHSMPSIASSAPEIQIAHAAQATTRIRLGSGGVMLPNHAPLRIAEAYHTLAALFPGRIDLGIGRAPGTDPAASRALRPFPAEQFSEQLAELLALSRRSFPEGHPFASVRVVPTDVALPPVWLLGSCGASARLAGQLGLGYSFAHHFSPTPPEPAILAYRDAFEPSAQFPRPHVILAVTAVCAETDEHADYLAASMDLAWVRLHRGEFRALPSPEEARAYPYTERERAVVESYRSRTLVGSPGAVRAQLDALVERTGADEVMLSSMIYDPAERLRSYELVMQEVGRAKGEG